MRKYCAAPPDSPERLVGLFLSRLSPSSTLHAHFPRLILSSHIIIIICPRPPSTPPSPTAPNTHPLKMGAGASAEGSSSIELFTVLMLKWDELVDTPQFAIDRPKPGKQSVTPPAASHFFFSARSFIDIPISSLLQLLGRRRDV